MNRILRLSSSQSCQNSVIFSLSYIKFCFMNPVWGIDLGGTKVEGVILKNRDSVEVIERLRIPTEAHLGYHHIVGQIKKCVDLLSERSQLSPSTIGIGTPGVLDPLLQTMKNCNATELNGQPLKKDLEKALRLEIKMANDANCFAMAEAKLGIVKDHVKNPEVVFGVIMGTGVGGGIVVHGEILYGLQGIGGEWGHTFLDSSGGDCYCGNIGCVEKLISGTALEDYFERKTGIHKKLKEIISLHKAGVDEMATATVHRLLHFFGKGMANVINIIDPEVVVLGGGLGNVDLLYTEGIKEVKKFVFNNRLDTKFLKPKLGDSAGVFGAALL